eukprot:gnl/Hemi2/1695_TR596_c1_g1_i1.p1 gnl/Hemi2/1695_TR596_c1_g1~~gnl/Hemi2/1695_TR596_c1_g1_i1.p1  ORF type:complete len:113 (+),score=44.88 gnl/Hemi2/1695_TR596_c1_g1_i1:62-400(+)
MSGPATAADERLVFNVEWMDPQSTLVRKFILMYFPFNCTLEMIDVKNKRPFLKKTEYPSVQPCDLYLGNVITVFSRDLHIVGFGDGYTAQKYSQMEAEVRASEQQNDDDNDQ